MPTYALDELVASRIIKLIGWGDNSSATNAVRSIVARIDVLPTSVKLVVRRKAVAALSHQQTPIELIRERLSPADEARAEPTNANFIGITIPVRMVVHGGRTWPKAPLAHSGPIIGLPDSRLVRDLRAAHEVLRRRNIETDGFDSSLLRRTHAPRNGRDRQIAKLAFLAPDIQQAILAGEPIAHPKADIPLSWAKQRDLFGLAQREC